MDEGARSKKVRICSFPSKNSYKLFTFFPAQCAGTAAECCAKFCQQVPLGPVSVTVSLHSSPCFCLVRVVDRARIPFNIHFKIALDLCFILLLRPVAAPGYRDCLCHPVISALFLIRWHPSHTNMIINRKDRVA